MALFQQSVQKKYVAELDKTKVEAAYQRLLEHFGNPTIQENIKKAKEEQYQEGFLRELFVDVLGYTLHPQPDFNLITEQKNEKDSKKADGAILKNGKPIAVIELKSLKTADLQAIELQAFNYKVNQKDCVYIITSNFQKIRFYIENAVDFEEFDLFDLKKERFVLLYLCLQAENILADLPLRIKKASIEKEESITQKLYNDYSLFKQALFKDISAQNKGIEQLIIYKKTQKLLDRFLFVFFAEDKGLLPPNSVAEILNQWDKLKELDAYTPLYNRFKLYFGYLNNGYKGKQYEIFAYNGGLFAPDALLDSLMISDNILYNHCQAISHYDFDTEVDTNILGHIFEHSLNEMDEIAQNAVGKRKKDGIFYTPRYITKYMVESTVGALCRQKKMELHLDNEALIKADTKKDRKLYQEKIQTYRDWLLKLTILDPACGSGAFLNEALVFLIAEHRLIDTMTAALFGDTMLLTDNVTDILENNIFGVDINAESVEIARLSLWLRTAKIGRKLNDLSRNIKHGNSLIHDTAVAGDLAFNWHKAFPNVFREKEKYAWHITCVMHNTCTSQRMIDHHIEKGVGEWLLPSEEAQLAALIKDIAIEDNLTIVALNICADHLHFVLVAENEEKMTQIVGKMKAVSARQFNIWRGITMPQQRDETRGHAPLPKRGTTQHSLWAQKFNRQLITSDKQLINTLNYIENNRVKHNLPRNTDVEKIVQTFVKNWDEAMHPEYEGGFEVVIGNPPYVRQELLTEFKNYFSKHYKNYHFASDLFAYFYEKAFQLLKKDGIFGYISNTFDKTTGGIVLRKYLQEETTFLKYIDFTEVQIFEGATTYPIILIAKNEQPLNDSHTFEFTKIPATSQSKIIDIDTHEKEMLRQSDLSDAMWSFKSPIGHAILQKMMRFPVVQQIFGKCYYGIKTGLNEAFIIPKTLEDSEFVKPIYEGRELKKWNAPTSEQQLILFKSKWTREKYGKEITEAEAFFKIKIDYKVLIEKLLPFEEQCKKRYDKGDFWWEMRNCAYYHLFEQPKIVFPNLQNTNKFAIDTAGVFINAPAVFLAIDDMALLAILNSKLVWYFLKSICVVRSGGYIEVKPQYFEQIPIPTYTTLQVQSLRSKSEALVKMTATIQKQTQRFLKLLQSSFPKLQVNKKLETWHTLSFGELRKELEKQKIVIPIKELMDYQEVFEENQASIQASQRNIAAIEQAIDSLVYELYELTDEEIAVIG